MSNVEVNCSTPAEEQKDSSLLTDISTSVNFTEATAAHFGISVQSFIPASLPSSNRKEKSRLAQLKARRRSNIGVRGSPETNSLIRFMAQQRMKTPSTPHTPEPVRSSPFQPRVASMLRQKMASFQSLMGVEESEDVMSKQDSNTGGCITTRDYLSDGENLEAGKENHPPSMPLPPNKKRRLGPSQGCEGEIREDSNPTLHFSLKELEKEEASVKPKRLKSNETQALVISSFNGSELPVSPDAQLWSPTEGHQEVVFELQSINQTTPHDPTANSPAQPASRFQISSISSLLEMKPTADAISSPTVKKKKKQVHFGEPLPPELFDKTLPPSTPLQKGGTPARAATPGGALKLRSLLKTPQRVESPSTQPQKELYSPSNFGASPTLSMPRSRRMVSTGEDSDEKNGKIPFPSEEIENEAANAEEFILNTQPLNLDAAFNEESLSQIETECETKALETSSPLDIQPPEPLKEEEKQPQTDREAAASGRSSNRRGKVTHNTTEAPARSSSRKRKLPEESEPVKRSTRTAAKTASGKMKTTTAARRWNKKVDHSLYGSREYASKTPILSPIRERLSFGLSFRESLSETNTAPSQEPHLDPSCNGKSVSGDPATEASNHTADTGDTAALNASTPPEVSVSFPAGGKGSGGRRSRRLSGSKIEGKAVKGGGVDGNGDQSDEKLHDKTEENTTVNCENQTNTEKLGEVQSSKTKVDNHKLCPASCLDTQSTESEAPIILDSAALIVSVGEELKHTISVYKEQSLDSHPENKTNHEVEKGEEDQTVQLQDNAHSSSDGQEDTTVQSSLPPWQDDFNFEDVFKPVASRGQRSVRRSLRNKNSADDGSGGLAWLPQTSPESIKESRRRTRGRQRSAALPAQAHEVTHP